MKKLAQLGKAVGIFILATIGTAIAGGLVGFLSPKVGETMVSVSVVVGIFAMVSYARSVGPASNRDPKIARRVKAALDRLERENPEFSTIRKETEKSVEKDWAEVERRIAANEITPFQVVSHHAASLRELDS